MKALLNMAKQKRKQNQPLSIKKPQFQPSQPSMQYDDEQFQVDIQQICAFAEFIGIQLPEEQDLLWIAKQGLQAELPPDWQQAETQEGQIVYTNVRTGDIIAEHPCDEYYRQLVIKERKKLGNKSVKKPIGIGNQLSNLSQSPFQPIGSLANNNNIKKIQKQPQQIVDPLVKMQRQKQQKKNQQHKRKQFTTKKNQIKLKFDTKKDQIQKEFKQKEEKTKNRFNEELQNQRKQQMKQLTVKQQQRQKKRQNQLNGFQKQQKIKQERQLEEKLRKEKEKLQKKYLQKREDLTKQLQNKLKKDKKQLDDVYKQKYNELQTKQRNLMGELVKLDDNSTFQQEVKTMKGELIRKRMKKYSQKLREQSERQKRVYEQQINRLQSQHSQRIRALQQRSQSYGDELSHKQSQKLEQIIKQIQSYEREEMKILEYELKVMREMKKIENEEKVQRYKLEVNQVQKGRVEQVVRQIEREMEKFKEFKEEEYQQLIYESEKKAKQDFLHALKLLEKKFKEEQEITLLENRNSSNSNKVNVLQKQNLDNLTRLYEHLQYEQKQLRSDRESLKLEIENLRSQNSNPLRQMNQQQVKLYELIQDKLRSGYNRSK